MLCEKIVDRCNEVGIDARTHAFQHGKPKWSQRVQIAFLEGALEQIRKIQHEDDFMHGFVEPENMQIDDDFVSNIGIGEGTCAHCDSSRYW
jgi:hypothetical protein